MTTQTITVERAQLKLWLEALNMCPKEILFTKELKQIKSAINAIKEALAQPAVSETHKQSTTCGEPVAIYQYQMGDGSWIDQAKHSYDYNKRYAPNATVRIVYTTPPTQQSCSQRQCNVKPWVSLSEEEREQHRDAWRSNIHDQEIKAIEAKLKAKNERKEKNTHD